MQDPTPQQSTNTPPPVSAAPVAASTAPGSYPGKGLGIAGFILAFVGAQVVGLILCIVGYRQSKKAGFKNTLAFVGIILNSVFLALAIILIPVIMAVTIANYNRVKTMETTQTTETTQSSGQNVQPQIDSSNDD